MKSAPTAAFAMAGAILLPAAPVGAAIRCVGPYQVVQGREIATPYCQDAYLARIAREYGMRVSADAVRHSPSVKSEVCRVVGRDNRAQTACAGEDVFRRRPF